MSGITRKTQREIENIIMKKSLISAVIAAGTLLMTANASGAAVAVPEQPTVQGPDIVQPVQADQRRRGNTAGRDRANRNRPRTDRRRIDRRGPDRFRTERRRADRQGRDRLRTQPRRPGNSGARGRFRGDRRGTPRWGRDRGPRYAAPPRRRHREHRRARRHIDGYGFGLFLPPILGYNGYYDNCEFFWRRWHRTGRRIWRNRYYRCIDY